MATNKSIEDKIEKEATRVKDLSINIKIAENGAVVSCYGYEGKNPHDKTYVYDSLSDAIKEIPAIVSVKKEEAENA